MSSTPPVTPQGQYTPGGQLGGLSEMRRESVSASASATLSPDTPALYYPPIAGFGLVVQLHSPSPTPSPLVTRSPRMKHARVGHKNAKPTASPSPSPVPSPSPSAEVLFSPSPSVSESLAATAQPGRKKKHADASSHQVELTFTVYPDSAPGAPTSAPSMPPILVRHALLQGNLHAQDPITLPSLRSLVFTLAKREQITGRGFTVAVIEERKHRKTAQVAFDINATMDADGVVRSERSSPPLVLEAEHRYAFILYADDPGPGATPAPLSSFEPSPGTSVGAQSTSSPASSPVPRSSPSPAKGLFNGTTLQGGSAR